MHCLHLILHFSSDGLAGTIWNRILWIKRISQRRPFFLHFPQIFEINLIIFRMKLVVVLFHPYQTLSSAYNDLTSGSHQVITGKKKWIGIWPQSIFLKSTLWEWKNIHHHHNMSVMISRKKLLGSNELLKEYYVKNGMFVANTILKVWLL